MNARKDRGYQIAIASENQIHRVDAHMYTVNSQSGNGTYDVLSTELGWTCACPTIQTGVFNVSIFSL